MKLTLETLKRIIKEELEEIRQSMIKPMDFGALSIIYTDKSGQLNDLGFAIVGASDPVELEILLKKAIQTNKLPSNLQVDMSMVDKAVYVKPANYDQYKNLKDAQKSFDQVVSLLKKLGLNISEG